MHNCLITMTSEETIYSITNKNAYNIYILSIHIHLFLYMYIQNHAM